MAENTRNCFQWCLNFGVDEAELVEGLQMPALRGSYVQ